MPRISLKPLIPICFLFLHPALSQADEAGSAKSQEVILSNYQLGPGDEIRIHVYGEQELSLETKVTDAGTMIYPFLGEIRVANLTIGQLANLIARGLKGRYLVDPKVSVNILEYRAFFMNGEVVNPGAYPYQPGLTVQKAVSLAGGFSERASRSSITIVRDQDATHTRSDAGLDTLVGPGDVVTVEESFF